jgi:hypothetical protein
LAADDPAQTLFDLSVYEDGWRECPRCVSLGYDGRYPESFFRPGHGSSRQVLAGMTYRHPVCMGCEDELDEDRSLRISLNQRIRDHAKRKGVEVAVYRSRYNLKTDAVMAWFKTKVASGVLDCGCLVSDMRHGNKDIEMHQTNPAEPFFPETWRLVCTNDHRQMHHPDHAAIKQGWRLWKEARHS